MLFYIYILEISCSIQINIYIFQLLKYLLTLSHSTKWLRSTKLPPFHGAVVVAPLPGRCCCWLGQHWGDNRPAAVHWSALTKQLPVTESSCEWHLRDILHILFVMDEDAETFWWDNIVASKDIVKKFLWVSALFNFFLLRCWRRLSPWIHHFRALFQHCHRTFQTCVPGQSLSPLEAVWYRHINYQTLWLDASLQNLCICFQLQDSPKDYLQCLQFQKESGESHMTQDNYGSGCSGEYPCGSE